MKIKAMKFQSKIGLLIYLTGKNKYLIIVSVKLWRGSNPHILPVGTCNATELGRI